MDPFTGEIRLMSFQFAPKGWLYCQGQLLPINQNQALFSLLGTTYGGDGQTTFALPDLRGRVIVGVGSAPDLSSYAWGQQGGKEIMDLQPSQIPSHTHPVRGTVRTGVVAELTAPAGAFPAQGPTTQFTITPEDPLNPATLSGTLDAAGNGQPHGNLQPLLVLNYAIATGGLFPKPPGS